MPALYWLFTSKTWDIILSSTNVLTDLSYLVSACGTFQPLPLDYIIYLNQPRLYSLQPNGLRVLSKLDGLLESLEGGPVSKLLYHSVLPEDEGVLSETDLPTRLKDTYGFGMLGVERATFHRQLIEYAEKRGIEIHWGHQVVGVEQNEDSVTVTFQNGKTDSASFVAGCDGLHSNTRISLFGKEEATFTGLVQVRMMTSAWT